MPAWVTTIDQLGPEKVLHVYDPVTELRGVVVVDTVSLGGAAGGTRMLPDITTEEIFQLARAMTHKFAILDFPIGGAKAGIWAEPSLHGPQRKELMLSFGKAVKPLLGAGITLAADMGTDNDDVADFFEGAEVPKKFTGLSTQMVDGEPLEDHATGYGVVVAALSACQYAGVNIKNASVAIEGFGKVGGGVARYITESGAKVVAISTINGAIYNKDGLDIRALLEARKTTGDKSVSEYKNAKHIRPQELYGLPVDILIPGARPYVITKKNAGNVRAKIISSIANIPMTEEAEAIIFKKGVLAVPDFISNAGGVILGLVDVLGGTADDVFRILRDYLGPLSSGILAEAKQAGINPRTLAVQKTTAKVLAARQNQAEPPDFVQLLNELKRRLGFTA
jgi:glutamate dehydrogenase/leucine dehydrogenase